MDFNLQTLEQKILEELDKNMYKYFKDLKYEILFYKNNIKNYKKSLEDFAKKTLGKIIHQNCGSLVLRNVGIFNNGFLDRTKTYEELLDKNLSLIFLQDYIYEKFVEKINFKENLIINECDKYINIFFKYKNDLKPIVIIERRINENL